MVSHAAIAAWRRILTGYAADFGRGSAFISAHRSRLMGFVCRVGTAGQASMASPLSTAMRAGQRIRR